jgi:hypothetical protein
VQFLRVRSILQLERVRTEKTTESTFRFEEEDLVLDDGIPNKIVTLKFYTAFLSTELLGFGTKAIGIVCLRHFVRSSQTEAIHLPKMARRDSLPCPLVQVIRSPRHFLFGQFGCRELATLTFLTSLTAGVDIPSEKLVHSERSSTASGVARDLRLRRLE